MNFYPTQKHNAQFPPHRYFFIHRFTLVEKSLPRNTRCSSNTQIKHIILANRTEQWPLVAGVYSKKNQSSAIFLLSACFRRYQHIENRKWKEVLCLMGGQLRVADGRDWFFHFPPPTLVFVSWWPTLERFIRRCKTYERIKSRGMLYTYKPTFHAVWKKPQPTTDLRQTLSNTADFPQPRSISINFLFRNLNITILLSIS